MFDRDEALRKAEKFARAGRLDQAMAEYERVVEQSPDDWKTLTTLADLYVKGQQSERAAGLFARIADHLAKEGFMPRAEAFYKRVLRIEPNDEHALSQLAAISTKQGILVEAKTHLLALARVRQGRGDRRGAAEILLRVGTLDPGDVKTRRQAARAAVEGGNHDLAFAEYERIADDLLGDERAPEAIEVLREGLGMAPARRGLRDRLASALVAKGEAELGQARLDTARDALAEALDLDPDVPGAAVMLARALVGLGDRVEAGNRLAALEPVTFDDLRFVQLEGWIRAGRPDQVTAAVGRLLASGLMSSAERAALLSAMASAPAEVAWTIADPLSDAEIDAMDWQAAIDVLDGFCQRFPGHLAALTKRAEIVAGSGSPEELDAAQSALVDAYLASGQAEDGRLIAEDLLSRTPGDPAAQERLVAALTMVGDPSPVESMQAFVAATVGADVQSPSYDAIAPETDDSPIDLTTLLDIDEEPGERASFEIDAAPQEIDLSAALAALEPGAGGVAAAAEAPAALQTAQTLDEVFAVFRARAVAAAPDKTAYRYRLALSYREMGLPDDAVRELESIAAEPRHRFEAALQLGRMFRERGDLSRAAEWFERAAEAPPTSTDAGRELLFDLGNVLEQAGEGVRALAVYIELRADAGDYRDVVERIDRLSRVQAED